MVSVYYVYILRCADDSFYVGSARDLHERVNAHNTGRGAAYTFKHRPVHLVYSESFETGTAALSRERQLKRWSHAKKQALVDGDVQGLKDRGKSRSARLWRVRQ
jgi:predicted GIY-YIG superfamily endonuclease